VEPVKQAVRENRQGKVRAAEYLILYDSPAVALLRSRMEVCVETHDLYTPSVWFMGYAPEFDTIELGARPPEYEAIFARQGSGLELMFRRAGRDQRIEEFKDARHLPKPGSRRPVPCSPAVPSTFVPLFRAASAGC
jgi:hypothetical protein